MTDPPTLTLGDVARLARVQRPVVSMWRRRSRVNGEVVSFPGPVTVQDGTERFDRDAIVAWIERTGRGNNPEFALDAVVSGVPYGATREDVLTMLWLRTVADRELGGLDVDGLLELADASDPDDECALTEVEQMGTWAVPVASYVDALYDVSYSPADAMTRLTRSGPGRLRERPPLDAAVIDLVAAIVRAVASDHDRPVVADGARGRGPLFLDTAGRVADAGDVAVRIDPGAPTVRSLRRDATVRAVGRAGAREQAVAVSSVVGRDRREAIAEVDELQLSLPAGDVAIVIGPASLLTDELDDAEVEASRDAVVRTGTLRLAARLPRGLNPGAPRQALALWVLASGQADRPIERRAVAMADLSDATLTQELCEDLATDAVAVLGEFTKHSFRFGRVVPTSRVIAARVLVPTAVRPPALVTPSRGEQVLRVERRQAQATAVTTRLAWRVEPGHGRPAGEAALGVLVDEGRVRVLPGTRLDRAAAHGSGSVRVLDPADGEEDAGFDPLDLELRHPRVTRTEPGDVVFRATPGPAAVLDPDGGHVVAVPARVLRVVDEKRVSPRVIATSITRQTGSDWRTWRIPLTPPEETARLESALTETAALRVQLEDRLRALAELEDALLAGTSNGAIAVTTADLPEPTTTDHSAEGR